MATKPRPSAAEIAEQKMPGWKAVKSSGPIRPFGAPERTADATDVPDYPPPKVDAVMPSTKQLRRKFLGDDAADAADETTSDPLESDVEPVDMKSGDLERTVGVNRRTQKIEWSQG
jgi:hypothetical protein